MISKYFKNVPRASLTFFDNLLCYLLDKEPRRGPLFVSWNICSRCNAKCVLCDRWEVNEEELSTKERLEIIRQLGESGVWMLSLCGGEPLLTKDLDLIIKEIKNQGMLINISTNGSLLKEKAKLIVDSKVDFITISVQSHIPEIHDSISGFNGLFKQLSEGISLVKEMRNETTPRIDIRLVLNKLTFSELDSFLKYWKNKVDDVILQPIHDSPHILYRVPTKMRFTQEDKKIFKDFYNLLKKYRINNLYNRMIPLFIFNKQKLRNKIKCFAGYFFLEIDTQGNLYSCAEYINKIGNLNERIFNDLLKSKNMKEFRKFVKNKQNNCICWHNASMLNAYLSKVL